MEEEREQSVLGAWQKAQEEAEEIRRARLRKHSDQAAISRSFHEDLPVPSVSWKNDSSTSNLDRQAESFAAAQEESQEAAAGIISIRSQSLPPSSSPASVSTPNVQTPNFQNPDVQTSTPDDRPIRPQKVDPLEVWAKMGHDSGLIREQEDAKNEIDSTPKRESRVRQSMRKSRSSEAERLEKNRRAGSLEKCKLTNIFFLMFIFWLLFAIRFP